MLKFCCQISVFFFFLVIASHNPMYVNNNKFWYDNSEHIMVTYHNLVCVKLSLVNDNKFILTIVNMYMIAYCNYMCQIILIDFTSYLCKLPPIDSYNTW